MKYGLELFKINDWIDEEIQKRKAFIATEVLNSCIRNSPVLSGRFRASWFISQNEVGDLQAKKTRNKDGSISYRAKIKQDIDLTKVPVETSIFIYNNVEYAVFVEDKHSVLRNAIRRISRKL